MRRIFSLLALVATIARAESPKPSTASVDLKDLSAWELVSATPADLAAACKPTADGSLTIAGKPVSYLATKATYANYRLHAEWRWPANAAKNSNSGVLLHVTGGPTNATAWPVCFQMQLKPTRAGDMLPMPTARFAEKLSTAPDAKTPQLDRTAADSEKPLGEWNTCDLVCRDGTIEVTVNGVRQNKVTGCTPAAGRVAFQLEGTPFELRHVRLDPLD
ncbi:MAG: DUF1080 domain-containing protein [Verrucomicrobia bacterium]|nr:DUF1080 domain-containing protein [Verrucomicrobiota bacterium]